MEKQKKSKSVKFVIFYNQGRASKIGWALDWSPPFLSAALLQTLGRIENIFESLTR